MKINGFINQALNKFNSKESSQLIGLFKKQKSEYWIRERERQSLSLFHKAAARVPAYKDFLKKNKIDPDKIKTWQDFQLVPPVNKNNYLRQYSLEKLSWDGTLKKPLVYTATSGSTGQPFYFTRGEKLDWQCSVIKEYFLGMNPDRIDKSTLVIVCFGMGVWIGGLITYKAFELVSIRNNYPISIITPGINKKEIFNALKILAPQYEQTIIAGYPPFVKDVVDEAPSQGINLKKLNLRVQFAAEAITESFRDYIAENVGMKNLYLDSMNIYGSADIGALAFESATGILIRRLAQQNRKLFYDIFSPINKTPTLAQYIPLFINFEAIDGTIALTGDSELPLIRYNIGDHGGVLSYDEVISKINKNSIDFIKEAKKVGIEHAISQLPFVYIYERADLSATFYGMWIYPEWLKDALIDEPISKYLTGKFTLLTRYNEKQDQLLEINLELKKDIKLDMQLKKLTLEKMILSLRSNSSEYRELSDKIKSKAFPKLNFFSSGDPTYFPVGMKQKWVKKD